MRPTTTSRKFTEAARAAPGTFNSGLVSGITELTFMGYLHHEKPQITQVPYRDIAQSPTDLGEGRIQVVVSALADRPAAVARRPHQADRHHQQDPSQVRSGRPDLAGAGLPSLELEGMAGLFGIKSMSEQLKEKIAADVREVTADGSIGDRLESTGQIMNIGGPKEFAAAIAEQSANVAAVVRAIDYKPKNCMPTPCPNENPRRSNWKVQEVPSMRTITLEEHFATPEFFNGPARFVKERAEKIGDRYLMVLDRLCDLGEKRLSEMDAAGIDMQVLSLSAPGVEQMETGASVEMARATNDYLADAVKKHPTRFAGFAALPTGAPEQAAQELQRRVPAGLQGRGRQRPQPRALSRQPVLLADPGMRRGAERADLSASDAGAEGGDRRVIRRLLADGQRHAGSAAPGAGTSRPPST